MLKSAAFLILVLSPLNSVWQRVDSSSIRILLILCFNILKLDATQPPSHTHSFKIALYVTPFLTRVFLTYLGEIKYLEANFHA